MKFFLWLLPWLCMYGLTAQQIDKIETKVIKVGASATPHAQILNFIKDDLAKQGYQLLIKEFSDYVTPNIALSDGEIDANYFQHQPYLDVFNKERNTHLVAVARIHVEPMSFYSQRYKNWQDIPNKSTIGLPNDVSNEGRALLLLQSLGLIKLREGVGLLASPRDIIDNPKKLKFKEMTVSTLPRVLPDVAAAVINQNVVLDAQRSGAMQQIAVLFTEDKQSPYANIIAVRHGHEKDTKIVALLAALQSEKVSQYMRDKYMGQIIPAF